MPRSRRSWTDLAVAATAVTLGIAAESNLYAWSDARHWLPDLLTGWTLIACGLVSGRRTGLLLAATGFTWFAGNFASSALVLHRGPLTHLLLTYPAGAAQIPFVAFAYLVAAATGASWGNAGTIAIAGTLLLGSTRRYLGVVGRPRREARYALPAAVLLAIVLALVATVDRTRDTAGTRDAALLGYQVSLCAVALYLAYGMVRRPWERPGVTDLVVDLGVSRAGTVRDALAQALGDPTLEVAYRVDGGYVDAGGRPTALPPPGSRRRVTEIDEAVLVHDLAVLDDPALVDGVAAATRLAAANARLQAEVRAQVSELEASRLRLLEAGDAERARLEARLRDGAARRLTALEAQLAEARAIADPATVPALDQAAEQLARTTNDLSELAAGLHPRDLVEHGLAHALGALAHRSPLPVATSVHVGRLSAQLEATIYFVCSEALANVAKHANATNASIAIAEGRTTIRVEVRDDGRGGAEPRSIADRVETIGGTLTVASPPNGGTHLVAVFRR